MPSQDTLMLSKNHRRALRNATNDFRSRNFEACAATLKTLIAEAPDNAEAHNLLGTLYQTTGNLEAAIESFRHTVMLRPDAPGAHNNLATVLAQSGHLNEATDAYDNAIRLAPRAAAIHYNKALALAAQDKMSEAVDALNETLELDPSHQDADRQLAGILSRLDTSCYLPAIERGLKHCFASERIDYVALSRLAARQLMFKYDLDQEFAP